MIGMTLTELIEEALAELDHPADTAALPLWRSKLERFANDAVDDLFRTFRPWRRDSAALVNGAIDLNTLPCAVSKVLGVEREGMRIPFYYGEDAKHIRLKGVADGPLTVVYRYLPDLLADPTDVPQLPSACHPLIVLYMCARFELHSDPAGLNHANMLMAEYERRKRRMRMDFDEPTGYSILKNG